MKGDISTVNGKPLNSVEQFMYLGSTISSTESDVNAREGKVWSAIQIISHMEIGSH